MWEKNDNLIYDLIFSDNTYYLIDIRYINDIYDYELFIDNIRKILKSQK
jgi:hypothetical protein